jgi:nucleotide-binding universal stress UspA family protein
VPGAVARQAAAAAAVPHDVVEPLAGAYLRLPVRISAVRSVPCRALIEGTAAADLVGGAAHRRPDRTRSHVGPVTSALLHHAHCPVAIVPIPADRSGSQRPTQTGPFGPA